MPNHFNIPLLWPFKMVPVTNTPGIHFDDKWYFEQTKAWQLKDYYFQKWQRTDTTVLQVESSLAPNPLRVLDASGVEVKTFAWVEKFAALNYKIYEVVFDISDKPTNAKYFVHSLTELGSFKSEWISECIHVRDVWPETLMFTFKNKKNKDGIAWSTGLQMKFRVEGWIPGLFEPKRVRSSFINQVRDVEQNSSTPFRIFKLYIGGTNQDRGVAPWVIDLMNRIMGCSSIDISGKKFQSEKESEWETWKLNTYSLMAASIDLAEATNKIVNQTVDDTPLETDIMVVYQIKTRFFGGEQLVQITDFETE